MSLRRGSQPIGGDRKKRRLCVTALRYVSAKINNIFSPIRSSGRDGLDNAIFVFDQDGSFTEAEFYAKMLASFSHSCSWTDARDTDRREVAQRADRRLREAGSEFFFAVLDSLFSATTVSTSIRRS